jgi:hypothetical protein
LISAQAWCIRIGIHREESKLTVQPYQFPSP